jgi:hypothetical protein
VNSNDFLINEHLGIKKKIKNNSTIFLSINYGTLFGKQRPYIEAYYSYNLTEKFKFSIGFPISYIEYKINQINSFSIESCYEGYYTKLSKNSYSRVLAGEVLNYKSLYLSRINQALIYHYRYSDNSIVTFSLGKSLRNHLEIEESNNQITNQKFNNSFTVSMGFKYNLNFK